MDRRYGGGNGVRRVARLSAQRIRGWASTWLDRPIQALIRTLHCDRFGTGAALRDRHQPAISGQSHWTELISPRPESIYKTQRDPTTLTKPFKNPINPPPSERTPLLPSAPATKPPSIPLGTSAPHQHLYSTPPTRSSRIWPPSCTET